MTLSMQAGTLHERASSFSVDGLRDYDRSSLYRDMSTALVVPTRGMIPIQVATSWLALALPVNQRCAGLLNERGKEVSAAYESLFAQCIDVDYSRTKLGGYAEVFTSVKFIVTMEEDNIIPGDGLLKLLAAIFTCPDCGGEVGAKRDEAGELRQVKDGTWLCVDCGARGYDAVSGLYWMKTRPPVPMVFGDPATPSDYRPRRVLEAIKSESVIEANGIAMGFAVWRADLFRQVSRPWFQTRDDCTQDIFFCKKAHDEAQGRFGVHCGVKTGHLDPKSGEMW